MSGTALPVKNATVTRVAAAGKRADYGRPAQPGAARWQGRADAYVVERMLTEVEGAERNEVKQTYAVVPVKVPVERGDTVTVRYGGVDMVRRVRDITRSPAAGTQRVWMEDE